MILISQGKFATVCFAHKVTSSFSGQKKSYRWKQSGPSPMAIVNAEDYFKIILWCRGADNPATCELEGECYIVDRDTVRQLRFTS